jgi:hypothetical protein
MTPSILIFVRSFPNVVRSFPNIDLCSPPICSVWNLLFFSGLRVVGFLSRWRTKWSFDVVDYFLASSRLICDLYLVWRDISYLEPWISDRSLILVVCDMFDSFMILSGFFWHLQNLFSTLADKLEFRLGISGFIWVIRCILAANHDRYH